MFRSARTSGGAWIDESSMETSVQSDGMVSCKIAEGIGAIWAMVGATPFASNQLFNGRRLSEIDD